MGSSSHRSEARLLTVQARLRRRRYVLCIFVALVVVSTFVISAALIDFTDSLTADQGEAAEANWKEWRRKGPRLDVQDAWGIANPRRTVGQQAVQRDVEKSSQSHAGQQTPALSANKENVTSLQTLHPLAPRIGSTDSRSRSEESGTGFRSRQGPGGDVQPDQDRQLGSRQRKSTDGRQLGSADELAAAERRRAAAVAAEQEGEGDLLGADEEVEHDLLAGETDMEQGKTSEGRDAGNEGDAEGADEAEDDVADGSHRSRASDAKNVARAVGATDTEDGTWRLHRERQGQLATRDGFDYVQSSRSKRSEESANDEEKEEEEGVLGGRNSQQAQWQDSNEDENKEGADVVEDPMAAYKNWPDYVVTEANFEAVVDLASNPNRELVFTTFSIMRLNGTLQDDFEFGMTAFNYNWVWHLKKAGVTKFLLVGMDEDSCAPTRARGIPCYVNTFDWLESAEIIKGRQVALKWLYLHKMVDLGFHPIFLDNDAATLTDPFLLWDRSFDIQALSDARPPDGILPRLAMDFLCGVGKSYGGQHYPCTSTGAMFVRSTAPTRAFLQAMVNKVEEEGPTSWEQAIFQHLILPFLMQVADGIPPLKLRILPLDSYHNAEILTIRREAGLPTPSVIVHCGFVYGGFHKRRALKLLKLWHEYDSEQ